MSTASTALTYAIKFVSNMDDAVRFHQQLGLTLRFQSPQWTEFATGATTLALHIADDQHPPGSCQLGFGVADVRAFYAQQLALGVQGGDAPRELHGRLLAKLRDGDGAEFSLGEG